MTLSGLILSTFTIRASIDKAGLCVRQDDLGQRISPDGGVGVLEKKNVASP
jgi:hypothetical protein